MYATKLLGKIYSPLFIGFPTGNSLSFRNIPEQQDDVIPMPSIPYFSHDCHLFEARGIWAPIRFVQHFNEQMQINYKQKGRHNSNKNIDAAAGCRGT